MSNDDFFNDDFEVDFSLAYLENGVHDAIIFRAEWKAVEKEDKGTSLGFSLSFRLADESFINDFIWLGHDTPNNRQGLRKLAQLLGVLGIDTSSGVRMSELDMETREKKDGTAGKFSSFLEGKSVGIEIRNDPKDPLADPRVIAYHAPVDDWSMAEDEE